MIRWVEVQDTIAIHDRLIVLHGGLSGIRDHALLESALARPKQHEAFNQLSDIAFLSAIYTGGIVSNHPFLDGNKRTGLVVGALFYEMNGGDFFPSEEDAVRAMIALADGSMSLEDYAAFVISNSKLN